MKIPGRPFAAAFLPLASRESFASIASFTVFIGALLGALPAAAINFPDTAELKKEYRVSAREHGHPVDFFRKSGGDSNSMHLEWTGASITSARIEQEEEFDPENFSVLTANYGNGAAWHEAMTNPDPQTLKLYPGLRQQWHLKGFAGDRGWLGSGVIKGRYFLVFRSAPPAAAAVVGGPLRLYSGLFAMLDTSSRWLRVPCSTKPDGKMDAKAAKSDLKTGKTGKPAKTETTPQDAPACFTPSDDSRLRVRIDRKKPISLQAWLEEGESDALNDIKKAVQAVPDAGQAEYAQDLSQMLLGEAQGFLVKFTQQLPEAFNWPSWQIQDFKGGQVKAAEFLPIVRRQAIPGDSLPAFRYEDPGLRLRVNLYYRGTFHMTAEAAEAP